MSYHLYRDAKTSLFCALFLLRTAGLFDNSEGLFSSSLLPLYAVYPITSGCYLATIQFMVSESESQ